MSPAPASPGPVRRPKRMRTSTERILTTHVGSLPRSGEVIELLYKKDGGEPYDRAAFDRGDGETSKVGYATYIKDRLSGFAGHDSRPPHLDLAPYPELREALGRMLGKQSFKRAACVGPVELIDRAAIETDIANLNAALAAHEGAVTEAF